jgi:putative tryptophan/tyrosine transport system substrate-binding protein
MRRRDFIAALSGAAAWPLTARPQQPAMPVIGFLDFSSPESEWATVAELRRGLKEAGYVEGQNVSIEFRWANNQPDVLPGLAADLVGHRVAVIIASGPLPVALAAKHATSTIPIVFMGAGDPVKHGLAASLNRPGGNITGVAGITNELAGKRLDLLRELVPEATTFGYLMGNPRAQAAEDVTNDLVVAARERGLQVIVLECRGDSDFEAAFATLVQRQPSALMVSAFPLAFANRPKVLALAALHKIPAIYAQSQYVREGGLMSYAGVGGAHQVGFYYVPQILKGAKPADLPVQTPTRFKLTINLKTAKALGLGIPEMLLATADTMIE